jgi:hypothetical protein
MPKGNSFLSYFWWKHTESLIINIETMEIILGKYFINLIKHCHCAALDNLIGIVGLAACTSALVREGGGNWEFVNVNRSNWEFVNVNGSDGQVVTLWPESVFISGPSQSEFLALGGDPVRGSSVGVAINVLVSGFAIRIVGDALHLLLHLRFLSGRVVGSRVSAK